MTSPVSRPARTSSVAIINGAAVILGLAGLFVSVMAGDFFTLVLYVPYAATGLILRIRRPENSIGPLLMMIGLSCALATLLVDGDPQALAMETAPLMDRLVAWGAGWGWPAAFTFLFVMTLVFPTGHLPDHRRSWCIGAIGIATLSVLAVAFAPTIEVGAVVGDPIALSNPIAVYPTSRLWEVRPSQETLFAIDLALLGIGVMLVILRYVRARGIHRMQLRWLTSAVILAGVGTTVGIAAANALGQAGDDPRTGGPWALLAWVPALVGITAIPVAIAMAVVRYRLYDIDRIISRAVGYSLILIALGLVYLVGGVWLPTRLLGRQPPIFVAGSTLAVAALFNPVRRRLLSFVDKRFYRSRYDAEQVAIGFLETTRDEVDPDRLSRAWLQVVSDTMKPSQLEVWIKD